MEAPNLALQLNDRLAVAGPHMLPYETDIFTNEFILIDYSEMHNRCLNDRSQNPRKVFNERDNFTTYSSSEHVFKSYNHSDYSIVKLK